MCGSASVFCPANVQRPSPVLLGFYSTPETAHRRSRTGQLECPIGSYCADGLRFDCPAGRYGAIKREINASCTGSCSAGYRCAAGSVRPDAAACGGGPRSFCPGGSSTARTARKGHYTAGGDGFTRTEEVECDKAHYCVGGERLACPAGRYGSTAGLSDEGCDGLCPAGFFCPTASTFSMKIACGSAALFCPAGSRTALAVAPGWYATGYGDPVDAAQRVEALRLNMTHTGEALCPEGFYCAAGTARQAACPAGRYGGTRGLLDANCTGPCAAGFYCPLRNTTTPRAKRCGDPSVICTTGASAPMLVTAGHFSTSANGTAGDPDATRAAAAATATASAGTIVTSTPSTRTHQLQCEAGSYCVRGLRRLCPAGRFGAAAGETNPLCSGDCAMGHYCPQGSTSATQRRCGAADRFCPISSPLPLTVLDGYYTVRPNGSAAITPTHPRSTTVSCREDSTAAECAIVYPHDAQHFPGATHIIGKDVRSFQRRCEAGHYCVGGLRYECKPGLFGDAPGLTSAACSGVCPAGYYCPAASTAAREHVCGSGAQVYCPTQSASPTPVTVGWYTVRGGANNSDAPLAGGSADASASAASVAIRDSQVICPVGHHCHGGEKFPCAPGRYGTKLGYASTSHSCEGACEQGYYCPLASHTARQHMCGNNSWFCPVGSSMPIPVARGMYTVSAHFSRRVNGVPSQLDAAHPTASYEDLKAEFRTGSYANEVNNLTAATTVPSRLGNATRVAQRACERGYFCSRGTKYQCPSGTWGNMERVDAADYDETRNMDMRDGITLANQIRDAAQRCRAGEGHVCGMHAVDGPIPVAAHGSPFGDTASRRLPGSLTPRFVLSGRTNRVEVSVVKSNLKREVTIIAPPTLFSNVPTPVVWFFDELRPPGAPNAWIAIAESMIASGRFVGLFPHHRLGEDGVSEVDWSLSHDASPHTELAFIDSTVEQLLLPHGANATGGGLDMTRQFAVGLGSGGMLAQLLATKRTYFAAIATLGSALPRGGAYASPLFYAPVAEISPPLSVLTLHGSNDTLCPPAGGIHSALLPNDPRGVLLSAEDNVGIWAKHNKCTQRVESVTLALNRKVVWSSCRPTDDASRSLSVTSYVLEWKEHDALLDSTIEGGLARLLQSFFDATPPLPTDVASFSAIDLGRGGHSAAALGTICSGYCDAGCVPKLFSCLMICPLLLLLLLLLIFD